ncbi:hypothetical protein ACLOJK_036290 [Asimina triloba]
MGGQEFQKSCALCPKSVVERPSDVRSLPARATRLDISPPKRLKRSSSSSFLPFFVKQKESLKTEYEQDKELTLPFRAHLSHSHSTSQFRNGFRPSSFYPSSQVWITKQSSSTFPPLLPSAATVPQLVGGCVICRREEEEEEEIIGAICPLCSRECRFRPRQRRKLQPGSAENLSGAKELVSVAAPAAVILTVTFVLWKLVEKLLLPKPVRRAVERKSSPSEVKWFFAPGTNLLSGASSKIEKESREKLNEFAQELRSFQSVDLSGRNFGDDGLFFLAESLGYNQSAEEVDFSANGITAAGLKAFDGVLQSNIVLKILNLSGNVIGDEGAKILADILVVNGSIQKLQLNSTGLGDEGARVLAEMLKTNSSLQVIELNNNMIDYSGFSSLGGVFLENNTIRGNYGGALGAAALAKGLEVNKSLRIETSVGRLTLLDIGNNEIGPKGAFRVADVIKKSKSLLWLNLYMNDIGDERKLRPHNAEASKYRFPTKHSSNFSSAKAANGKQSQTEPKASFGYALGGRLLTSRILLRALGGSNILALLLYALFGVK